ncbi:MAG: hypothetical protein J5585_09905 [Clostridia bacterium]|nr:hypothetical protein [Clostridia bacterium]
MKKRVRSFFCVFLSILMLLLFGCNRGEPQTTSTDTEATTDAPDTEGEIFVFDDGIKEDSGQGGAELPEPQSYSYSQDFEAKIKANDADWYVNTEGTQANGVFSSKTNHAYFACRHKIKADVFVAEWDVNANRKGNVNNVSEYVGLRLPEYGNQFAAVGTNGIWLSFQCNSVGVISTWPTVKTFRVDVDFSQTQRVRVTDDVKNDVITVEVKIDGVFEKLFSAQIENQRNVTVFNAEGKDRIHTEFSYDVGKKGFFALWASGGNTGESFIDNVEIKWTEAVPETYYPADKTAIRDLYSDTWVATDDLDRAVTDGAAAPRDKLVGMFYQIWFTPTSVTYPDQKIYNHYQTYLDGGIEAVKKVYTQGPEGWGHYWGEPYFGYYLTNDRWVIRKHASMLSDIGVDFIFLDVTNGNPQSTSYKAIFKEYEQMRKEGLHTPDICFFLADNVDLVENVFLELWDDVYSTKQYSDLYVMYDGKPLILGNFKSMSKESKKIVDGNFTWRRCWALKENVKNGKDFWTWMCESPQVISYKSTKENVEEISISAAILANTSSGRSSQNGKQPKVGKLEDGTKDDFQFNLETTGQGLFFAEQMERASEVDPYVVLITEWNEWAAGRWNTNGHNTIANTYISWSTSIYVDCFNPEFSRDIEPMKGGFGDNYYYQLAKFMREFKGSRAAPAASGQHDITLDGGLSQWADVRPEYRDTTGDTLHRDSLGNGGLVSYKNETGRNDIVSAKVSRSNGSTYFLAVCADKLTAPEGSNWMNLFIDADCDAKTGWYGYDLIVNRENGSVERFKNNSWETEDAGKGEIYIGENYVVIKLDDKACGLGSDFNFKWADNSTETGEIMQFLDLGDAAPNARFNYAYRSTAKETRLTDNVKTVVGDGASFTANRPYALSDGKTVPVYEADTSVLPVMYKNRLFVPAASLGIIKDMTVAVNGNTSTVTYKDKTFTFEEGKTDVKRGGDVYRIPVAPFVEDGVLYVPLNAVAHIAGLNCSQNDLGVAIITAADLSDGEKLAPALNDLYLSY